MLQHVSHGDTKTCLASWTEPDLLSGPCQAALPKVESNDAEDDAEDAVWRAKRKSTREQTIKDIEKGKVRNGETEPKAKAKKTKKEL